LKKGQCQKEKIKDKELEAAVLGTPFAREAVSSAVAQAMPAPTEDQQMLAIRLFGGIVITSYTLAPLAN
jgi:hypothetical protein